MTVFGKILRVIGSIFTSLMKEAEHVYEQQTPELKLALENGSGVSAVINSMLDAVGKDIRAKIKELFPSIDEAELEDAIFKAASDLQLGKPISVDDALEEIAKYLRDKKFQSPAWEWASFAVSGAFSLFFAPAGTKFTVISQLLEVVYHKIVKPKVQ